MEVDTQAHIAFYLTGRQFGDYLEGVGGMNLRPALLARFRELSEIRYDFPVVLIGKNSDDLKIDSLSHLMDKALKEVEPGNEGDRIRKTVLQIEKEMRQLISSGAKGKFSTLWNEIVNRRFGNVDKAFMDSLNSIRASINVDGELVDCDESLPERLVRHLWDISQNKKSEIFRKKIDRLIVKLSYIIKSEFEHSEKGRTAEHLKDSIGGTQSQMFDFSVMSSLLSKALPKDSFPESRRQRIGELLSVLKSQKFYPSKDSKETEPYQFVFESCNDAIDAYMIRMPKVIELAKAIAIAELEIEGQYNPIKYNILFEDFGANGLDPREMALFPDYLVYEKIQKFPSEEYAKLLEILSSDLPIKILLQTDDILAEPRTKEGNLSSGMRSKQFASMAIGLNAVYVVQTSNSHLFQFHERIYKGLNYNGPSLFCIYSGASGRASGIPPYLMSAAAMESRAYPAFAYDPSAGINWASRFYLQTNPQIDQDWPVQHFMYEDEKHQRVVEDIAFTFIDFIACDQRYAKHFARIAQTKWNGSLVPIDESLAQQKKGLPDKVPYITMVSKDNELLKVIVNERMIREAKHCREMWHSLQELGGIHSSHAEILLQRERRVWEASKQKEADQQASIASVIVTPAANPASPPIAANSPVPESEPERNPDEAYIDSARCSTCNECITLNSKMFAYNGNKQAYIADISAGTYAQLVEAAENCQVSIIHPGKPRNPKEPGLEELLKRAELFK